MKDLFPRRHGFSQVDEAEITVHLERLEDERYRDGPQSARSRRPRP